MPEIVDPDLTLGDRGADVAADEGSPGERAATHGVEARPPAEQPDQEQEPDRSHRLVWLGLALTLLPLVVAGIHQLLVAGDYYPSGDVALTELHTRDVGSHTLWLGPYSRDGWHHPGPALFYLFALPYRLLGSSGAALAVAGLLVNGGSVAGMVVLAKRRGGTTLALSLLLVCALLLRALGWEFLRLPWNVYVTVLPYGLLVFLVWAMVCRERWALPAAAVVTTFLVQTHVGYLALALPLFGLGLAGMFGPAVWQFRSSYRADRKDSDGLRPLLWPAVCAAAVGVVMWLPPVVEQLTTSPGNLRNLASWFRDNDGETRSLTEGWRVVSAQYGLPPEWLAGAAPTSLVAEPQYVSSAVLPVLLLPVLVAAVMLWRRGGREPRALTAVWLVGSLAGVVAVVRTVGLLYAYRLQWAWVLGMIGGLLVVWLGWQLALERGGEWLRRALAPAVLVALAVMSLVSSVTAVRAEVPTARVSSLLAELAPDLRHELDDLPNQDDDVLVAPMSFGAIGVSNGLVLDLERHGLPARVGDDGLGDHRRHTEGDPLQAVVTVAVDADIPPMMARPDLTLVAYTGIPMDQLREATAEQAALDEDLAAGRSTLAEHMVRSENLVPTYSAAAIFLETPPPS